MSLIDEYLQSQAEKERPPNTLYVTDLTKPCLLDAYYSIVDPQPFPIETLRIFQAGKILEDFWISVLMTTPNIQVLDTQVQARFEMKNFSIHGKVDVLTQTGNGSPVAREIKTAKTCYFLNSPKPEHVAQLNFYMNVLEIEEGIIDYLDKTIFLHGKDRGDPEEYIDKSFPITRDPYLFDEMLLRADILWEAWKEETPPEPTQGWKCNGYCQHVNKCPIMKLYTEVP